MTKLLDRAFEAASRLPEAEQDEIAALVLGEIESMALLDGAIESTTESLQRMARETPGAQGRPGLESLGRLADETLAEAAGKTTSPDPKRR
jgi:hypothetical protein